MSLAPAVRHTFLLASLLAVLLGCSNGAARPPEAPPAVAPEAPPAVAPAAATAPAPRQKLSKVAETDKPEHSAKAAFSIENPYAVPGVFRKAQFHLHTANSFDGDKSFTPEAIARTFKEAGYGFVVFTDHEVASKFSSLNDPTFYAGTGFESSGGSGHIGALFTDKPINPALPPELRIVAIRQAGGIAVANHPDWEIGYSAEQLLRLQGYQCLEIYNHISTQKRPERLQANLEKWRRVLNARGRQDPVWAIAVSDTHKGFTGGGWTMVKTSEVSEPALKAAITRGSMYATTGPEFRSIEVVDGEIVVQAVAPTSSPLIAAAPAPIEVRFLTADGHIAQTITASVARYRPTGQEQWVRIEASDAQGNTAWSQPLWITPRS
jgi:hypothetical protein